MAQFMLILSETPATFASMPPEEMQKVLERYMAWSHGLAQRGAMAGGNKLKDEGGKILRRQDGKVRVVDGPYAEAKEVVGGYYLIEADGYDQAVALTADCPHLDYGGKIEIREIDPMVGPA